MPVSSRRLRRWGWTPVAAGERPIRARQGVDLSGEQQTKTRTALTYFSRALQTTATAEA